MLNILKLPYPVSNNIYYRKYRNIMILSKKGQVFKNIVKNIIKTNILTCDVELIIIVHPRLTKKTNKAYARVIDLDNSLKCVLDSLNGIAYIDDKQVKKITLSYGEAVINGGTSVQVLSMI